MHRGRSPVSLTAAAVRAVVAALAVAVLSAARPAVALELQGHRGARGLAPENTIAAFERALAIGVDVLEMDVGLTADGVVVVAHDPALNPAITRDASGRFLTGRGPAIRSLTLAQLQTYDVGRVDPSSAYGRSLATQQGRDGERIPTLAAVFARVAALGSDVRFSIETKLSPTEPEETADPETLVRALLEVVRRAGMGERVVVQSFDWRTLAVVRALAPAIPTVHLTSTTGGGRNITADGAWTTGLRSNDFASVPHLVKAAGGAIWSPNVRNLTEADLATARSLGLRTVPWTVNDPADMERLVDWGVDGIISDHPDRLRAVMARRGLPLPRPVAAP